MSEVSLKFGGKLIEELSQKIPSTLFALNELIKNAYDAFSPDITIKVDTSRNTITISDNGNGMGADEIESLFHISQSSKRYGHVVEQNGVSRITQGSKGLGFLAVFKFGDEVQWATRKSGVQSTFSLKKSNLVTKQDLTGTRIPITTEAHEGKGTTIIIYSNSKDIEVLLDDLNSEKVSEKLAAAIADENFDIKIEIENQATGYSTKKLKDFKLESDNDQLFYVSFDSEDNNIEFYHKGELLKSISGLPELMRRTDYSINIELIIFHFRTGRNSKSISPLNKRLHDDALSPLIYFNQNLFNNIVIFDPELLRKTSSGNSLPQMIGRISLRSQSEEVEFNSDRTNFVENFLTKSLIKNLKTLNELIQINGSELKRELLKDAYHKKIPTGKAAPASKPGEQKKMAASISINRKMPLEIYTPSNQIELDTYIFQVKNSLGAEVNKNEVEIAIDGVISSNGVLHSIEEPCEKSVCYRYQDPHTSLVSTEIKLKFSKKISNVTGTPQRSIFTIESESGYHLSQGVIANLIYAIDKAYQARNKDDYLPLIACSIRCIFDVSWLKISKTKKQWFNKINKDSFNSELKKELNSSLTLGVMHVLILLKKNQSLLGEISNISGITFRTLNSLLDLAAFGSAVKLSNVGAHSSSSYLSKPKLEECANKCGLFAVICDILINLDSNRASSLNIVKLEESDFETYMG
ncbi:ATP-binding protein [Pseudomonas capsici]|uniref:ATP-binding protein n=1 Tax=Pseudomonas capsici TaxID=2810614 RepID=A0ABT3C1K8_9PSED|nr:ATP-binding protein [Pseudomonas capsici]MCV4269889.1 ATP-binding protein [Pseudomonas capsici]MCV4280365.1 ATP-binding protein [Pseudomonas capsici]MCV4333795.1 ATP-binding protein [Pseudomonas capsici]MCV4378968.1 ATP-binding protein [Pseudomonas capsici]